MNAFSFKALIAMLALGGAFSVRAAYAGDCGPAPMDIEYSTEFQQAQMRMWEEIKTDGWNADIDFGIDLPVEGVPVPVEIGLSGGRDVSSQRRGYESMTINEAKHYIQREHADRDAQIVDECLYRMCELTTSGANPGSIALALSFQAAVCDGALGGGAPAGATQIIETSPPIITVAYHPGDKAVVKRISVVNEGIDRIKLTPRIDTGTSASAEGVVTSKKKKLPRSINLQVRRSKSLDFVLNPPASGRTEIVDVVFERSDYSGISARTKIVLIPAKVIERQQLEFEHPECTNWDDDNFCTQCDLRVSDYSNADEHNLVIPIGQAASPMYCEHMRPGSTVDAQVSGSASCANYIHLNATALATCGYPSPDFDWSLALFMYVNHESEGPPVAGSNYVQLFETRDTTNFSFSASGAVPASGDVRIYLHNGYLAWDTNGYNGPDRFQTNSLLMYGSTRVRVRTH